MRLVIAIAAVFVGLSQAAAQSGSDTTRPVDTARIAADTGAAAAAGKSPSPAADSTGRGLLAQTGRPSLRGTRKDSLTANLTPDTSYHFWLKPFWAFGISWTVGGLPVFDTWQQGLVKTLREWGLNQYLGYNLKDSIADTLIRRDTMDLAFQVKDPPNTYNIEFPLSLTYYFRTRQNSRLSADLSGYFIRKTYQAVAGIDTMHQNVSLKQTLGFYAVSIGLNYQAAIPTPYFSIGDVDQTSFCVGLAVTPLAYVSAQSSAAANYRLPEMRAVEDTLRKGMSSHTATGFGFSWRIGLSALKKVTPHSGYDAGLFYLGRWAGFPGTTNWDIQSPRRSATEQSLSFVCHRLEIRLSLLQGKKLPPKPRDDGESAAPQPKTPGLPAVKPEAVPADSLSQPSDTSNAAP